MGLIGTLENWIPLGDKHRIALHRDEVPVFANPVEEQEGEVGCFPVRTARGLNGVFADTDTCDELKELASATEATEYSDLQNEMVEYLEKKGLEVLPVALRGYGQSEWMDVLLWTNPNRYGGESKSAVARNVLSHVARDLGCWFRGDVYVLAVEELITYTAPNGATIERWEPVDDVDPVYQNYFDSRPELDDILNRLEIDPANYGVTDDSLLQLQN
jgi:hypothetical protein